MENSTNRRLWCVQVHNYIQGKLEWLYFVLLAVYVIFVTTLYYRSYEKTI